MSINLHETKVGDSCLYLSIRSNSELFMRKPLFVDVILVFSSRTRQYLFNDWSTLCSSVRLLEHLVLNWYFFEATSEKQYVLLQSRNIYEHLNLNFSLKSPGTRLSCLRACHSTFGEKTWMHQQWNFQSINRYRYHYVFISGRIHSSSSSSARARYSDSVHFQLFELVHVKEFGIKVAVQFQHSYFCILKEEKLDD